MSAFFGAEEIWIRHADDEKEPVLLVGVWETAGKEYASEEDFLHSMDELSELAGACMMEPMGYVTQQLSKVNNALYVGTGKAEEIREDAARIFNALGCYGIARADFFLDEKGPVFNEINTMPGFTAISMYPMLFEAVGISYRELVQRLIDSAFLREEH